MQNLFQAVCQSCGTPFRALVGNAKYCTSRCRARAERARKRHREREQFGTDGPPDDRFLGDLFSPSLETLHQAIASCRLFGKSVKIYGDVPGEWSDTGEVIIGKAVGEEFHILTVPESRAPTAPKPPKFVNGTDALAILRDNLSGKPAFIEPAATPIPPPQLSAAELDRLAEERIANEG